MEKHFLSEKNERGWVQKLREKVSQKLVGVSGLELGFYFTQTENLKYHSE